MSLKRNDHSSPLIPVLLDTKELITDKFILRQLTHFAHIHRLGSPLWLSWELSACLSLTLRYMQSPLNLWYPLIGDSFYPILPSSSFFNIVTRQYPINNILNVSELTLLNDSNIKNVIALSAAVSPDGNPRWCYIPKLIQNLFKLANKSSHTQYYKFQENNNKFLSPNLWISKTLVNSMRVKPNIQYLVHTPGCFMRIVNADQLYPSYFLAEKELECLVLQSSIRSKKNIDK